MKPIGVALSICVVAATALATSAMPWAWEDTVITWLDVADLSMVGPNAPAIALDANRILTGALDEDSKTIFSEEATNGVRPEVWTHEEVFSDANVDDLWPPAFGLTTDWRQTVWCLKDNGATELVHKRGDLTESGWSDDTALLARNPFGWGYDYSMATQGDEVFIVYATIVDDGEEEYGLLALTRSSSGGEPGTWSTVTIKKVEGARYGSPTVAVFKDGSNPCEVYVCYLDWFAGLKYIRSTNGGTTWSYEQVVDEDAYFYDRPCIQSGDWYNSSHDHHGLFLTWGRGHPVLTFSSDNGESWGGRRYALPQNRVPMGDGVDNARISAYRRGVNDFRLALTAKVSGPWIGSVYTWTIAHVGNGLGCIREWLTLTEGSVEYSCVGDQSPSAPHKPRLRTVRADFVGDYDQSLSYQGAEYTFDAWPVAVYPTIRGPGRLIASNHDVVQPGFQGVSEANLCGDTFICYHSGLGDTSGWDVIALGHSPALATDENGCPWVVFERHDSLFSMVSTSDTAWSCQTVFAAASGKHLRPPSLAVFQNATGRIGNVCFPVYSASTSGSRIAYIQFDTCGNLRQNLVDSLPGSYADSFPCISVSATDTISIVYQHSSNCYKRRLVYSPTTNSTIPDTWPGASAINSTQGATIRYPFCERIGPRLWVTYSYEDQGDWVIKRVSCLDTGATTTWEGEANLSNVDAHPKYWPVLSTPAAVTWTESLDTHCAIMANISDSLLQLTGDTSCGYVSLLADTAIRETPSTNMTRVRYLWLQNYSGDTWTVPYAEKDVRASDAEANVTRYNQGAKLAIASDDSLSSVYRTSQGSIYFCRQKDGDAGWSSSLLSNSGESPAVANSCHDRIWTCERDATSPTAHVIRCHNRATGSNTWQSFTVYSVSAVGQAGSRLGPAAIAACPNDSSGSHDAAYIAFTVYTSVPPKSTIVMAKVDTGGVIYYVDTLHSVASFNDSFPSVALAPVSNGSGYKIEVGWQNGTEIYTRKTTNYDHPEYTTQRTWSTAYNLSNTQSNSRHPLIAANSDTILVAWVEADSGRILVKGQTPTSAYNSWGDTVNVSLCPDSCTDYPGIALGDSNIVTYQKKLSSSNYDIIARVNFHSNLNLSNSSTKSTYDHSLFYLAGGTTPVIASVWTEELSANYAEVAFQRWELGQSGGGGGQSASVFDPGIRPMLHAPAPNPFNGLTTVKYQTNIRGPTKVSILDITGRRVRNLLNMPQKPGIYTLTWNARDDRERQLPRGIYFVRLETANYSEARKLILTE